MTMMMLYKYILSFQCFSSTKGAQGLEQCFFHGWRRRKLNAHTLRLDIQITLVDTPNVSLSRHDSRT